MITRLELESITPYKFSSDSELIKEVNLLIENYTVSRDTALNYQSEKAISAYLYYFFATNLPKLKACFEKLPLNLVNHFKNRNVIEIGTGPGTIPISWQSYLGEAQSFSLIEDNQYMRNALAKVLDFYQIEAKVFENFKLCPKKENAVLVFSHSFNELDPALSFEIIRFFDPESIIFIEPGTKESFKKLMDFRENLEAYNVHYPCNQKGSCEAFANGDWCHQYLKLTHDPSIEALTQKLKRDRRNCPILFHVYSKTAKFTQDHSVIFSKPTKRKYGYDVDYCALEDQVNKLQRMRVLKKEKEQFAMAKNALAGDLL
jgi:ribosomal protein RSM22 (predicted rRNA methylase)